MGGIDVSVVVPVYNSEATIVEVVEGIRESMNTVPQFTYEILLVNDCSSDNVLEIISRDLLGYGNIIVLDLTRNFGQVGAILAGWNHAQGDFIVNIDDDMQFSPKDIPRLIAPLVDGFDVVYGVPIRSRTGFGRRIGTWMINKMYRSLFSRDHNRSAFSAVRREITDVVCTNQGANLFLDGYIAWYTNNITSVEIIRSKRKQGQSGHNFSSLVRMTFDMLTSHSMYPLLAIAWLSFFIALLGLALSGTVVVMALINERTVPGWSSLFVGITLFSSIQLFTLGMMGEYVARVHLRLNNQPQFLVREKLISAEEE